ncbi:hypothetical protein IAT38_007403 [Cryptococcus sp. DSM 104549]
MVRSTAILRNAAKAAADAAKPKPMSSDHTLYHYEATGFWKKFRDVVAVNPNISTGLPMPKEHRWPQPASRPEKYATPASKASDPAFNPYWKRDSRRSYPQTSVITQPQLTSLLLSSPSLASLPSPESTTTTLPSSSDIAPTSPLSDAQPTVLANEASVPSLTSVLDKMPAGTAFYGGGLKTGEAGGAKLPPSPPSKLGGKWVPKDGAGVPTAEFAYFPMYTVA